MRGGYVLRMRADRDLSDLSHGGVYRDVAVPHSCRRFPSRSEGVWGKGKRQRCSPLLLTREGADATGWFAPTHPSGPERDSPWGNRFDRDWADIGLESIGNPLPSSLTVPCTHGRNATANNTELYCMGDWKLTSAKWSQASRYWLILSFLPSGMELYPDIRRGKASTQPRRLPDDY